MFNRKAVTSVSIAIIIGSVLAVLTIIITLFLTITVTSRMIAINSATKLRDNIDEVCKGSSTEIGLRLPNRWGLMKTGKFKAEKVGKSCDGGNGCICATQCVSAPRVGRHHLAIACFSLKESCGVNINTYHFGNVKCPTDVARKSYGYNGEGYIEAYCAGGLLRGPCPSKYKFDVKISKQNSKVNVKVVPPCQITLEEDKYKEVGVPPVTGENKKVICIKDSDYRANFAYNATRQEKGDYAFWNVTVSINDQDETQLYGPVSAAEIMPSSLRYLPRSHIWDLSGGHMFNITFLHGLPMKKFAFGMNYTKKPQGWA